MAQDPSRQGMGCTPLAGGSRRHRLGCGEAFHLQRGDGASGRPATVGVWSGHGRSTDHQLRYGRAEGALPSEDPQRRGVLVSGLLGAGLGKRSSIAADDCRGRGRPFHRQWTEDVDFVRPVLRLDLLPRADRSFGQEAGGDHVPFDRSQESRRRGEAHADARAHPGLLRHVLRQREGSQRERRWQHQPRLDDGEGSARSRANAPRDDWAVAQRPAEDEAYCGHQDRQRASDARGPDLAGQNRPRRNALSRAPDGELSRASRSAKGQDARSRVFDSEDCWYRSDSGAHRAHDGDHG